ERRGVYAGPGISVKLSALHPRYARAQRERVLRELLPRIKQLCLLARQYDIGLNIDAEEAERLDLSLDLLEALALDPELGAWNGIGFVVQAYQKRCPFVVDYLVELAQRSGHRLMIRLVKGAYWDSEIKRAQVDGLEGYPVYTRKRHSDVAYLACAQKLLAAGAAVYPQFATHNALSLCAVYQLALDMGVDDYEFQCLHGMGETLYDQVVGAGNLAKPCRIYAPVGSHESLLPYLVRRLLENGANSSFVNRIVDEAVSIDELIADPLQQVRQEGGQPHPAIPLPQGLYGSVRRNSLGLDLANESRLASLTKQQALLVQHDWEARPLYVGAGASGSQARGVTNPANHDDRVGRVIEATPDDVAAALAAAQDYAAQWAATPVAERAALLERTADLLESERDALISLCVREAGKTWANAVSEVREAADFCRYYAQEMRRHGDTARRAPAGPVVCISPWNFPLAIFTGQVAAALVAGYPVIAKPAEQTPLIAAFAVRLMHRAGVPLAALQLLPGRGEVVGAALVADPRVRGVLFTGSAEVARAISRAIAGREAILIAETGGQNALIVDSSALPEQVVQDVLSSAFDSAGQRCSALRVLCVQDDIADKLLGMLQGAMNELRIGDPGQLSTDIGPVIDAEAKSGLLAHIEHMRALGRKITQLPLPPECDGGTFVPPTLIEIDSLNELQGEVFGPVLHYLRFRRQDFDTLIDAINATGYGLTLGLHSRIDETIADVVARAHVGNIYVNRNMVGAVVGVQPFGGEGKSGTGPKAGGPLYLHRLLGSDQVVPAALGLTPAMPAASRLDALGELTAWAQASGQAELAEQCADCRELTLLDQRFALAGPTGESNTLAFAPRGTALCLADTEHPLLIQIAAALATGNDILLVDTPLAAGLHARLPTAVSRHIRITHDWHDAAVAAVLVAGNRNTAVDISEQFAARDGALIPLLFDEGAGYPLYRLLAEHVVSVNTTAAGGNATLMTLDS
ncbi:MAG: bifunctional proline dehydrogenase/L-glutamate gamma-semialdehyde dehydrogenase PutA, partial [Sterolibacterium sp.]